jgi:glyoxylase-like metal-dependent hydrolase (beta-lactamase superfamily II)
MTHVRVRALQAGYCLHPQVMSIRDGSWWPVRFPALSMLLVHPCEGPILFDTGYDPAFMAATRALPERLYRWLTPVRLEGGKEVSAQLVRLGFDPLQVRHVVISHFHADHIAGIHAFPNATLHCARAGFDAICTSGRFSAVRQGLLRALVPPDFALRAMFFEDAPRASLATAYAPFDEGVDLLGDGSVLAVELPGHCPGHWGLAVKDDACGDQFLVADAAWSMDAIRRNVPPPALATAFLGNTAKARDTLNRLHLLSQRNPELRITPCHCPDRARETVP